MPRWDDDANFEHHGDEKTSNYEENRLLRKFEDYRKLEKKELEKMNPRVNHREEKTQEWTNRFVFLTVIQSFIIVGITASIMLMEYINSEIKYTVMLLTFLILGVEIAFIYKYFRKRSQIINQKYVERLNIEKEFDLI